MSDRARASKLISVKEARERILALAQSLPEEKMALKDALGRQLTRAPIAMRDQPPFDASAMDGYAVIGAAGVGDRLHVVGEAGAGHAFQGRIIPGQALRIFTGAPVPQGADHVIIQEDITRDGDEIIVNKPQSKTNIRPKGQDFAAGSSFAPRKLRAVDLALLAAMNIPEVWVARAPELAIIATGDELVSLGETPRDDQIIASSGIALAALAKNIGAKVRILPLARDTLEAHRAVFALAKGADVIVTIGGASVGDHDLVGRVAQDMGMDMAFWKVALRPGKPLIAGKMMGAVMLGLPGNPVSSLVCAELFLLPLLRAMQGEPNPGPHIRQAPLAEDLPANGPRSHYMRAEFTPEGAIRPFKDQDSSQLSILSRAQALLIHEAGDGARKRGELMGYISLDG